MKKLFSGLFTFILLIPIPALAFTYTNWNLDSSPAGWSISNLSNILTIHPISGNGNNEININGEVTNTSVHNQNLGVVFSGINTFTLDKGFLRVNIYFTHNINLLKMEGNNQFDVGFQPNDHWINSLVTPVNFTENQSSEIHIQIKFTGDAQYKASSPFTLTFSN